jgi:hypothetical protein
LDLPRTQWRLLALHLEAGPTLILTMKPAGLASILLGMRFLQFTAGSMVITSFKLFFLMGCLCLWCRVVVDNDAFEDVTVVKVLGFLFFLFLEADAGVPS